MSPSPKARYRAFPSSSKFIMPCSSQPLHSYPSSSQFLTSTTMTSSSYMSDFCEKGSSFAQHYFWYPSMMWSILVVCSLFYRVILHCISTTEFVYPFSWTYGLFLVLVGFFFPCLFLFGADMNTAVVNILTQVDAWTYVFKFFLDKYLGVKCLGHRVDICL